MSCVERVRVLHSAYVYRVAAVTAGLAFVVSHTPVRAQDPTTGEGSPAALFEARCAECHSDEQSGRTPTRFSLNSMTPRAIVSALQDGVMRREGADLSDAQRIQIAEHLTGRVYSAELVPEEAFCQTRGYAPLDVDDVRWMGYGGDLDGTGFQSAEQAGLTADDVPQLELMWAFGFPGASQVRTKPTVVGDLILVGDQFGGVYALEARTGCVRWTFEADSGVRGAIPVSRDESGRAVAYIVDSRTNAYALDTGSGEVLWKTRVGWHPESNNTGSPSIVEELLIVPISTMGEVVSATSPTYECCTSSGAVAALNLASGDLEWYHRVIQEPAVEAGTNAAGTQLWAPSGAPVWSSPTIDLDRRRVYAGSGENLSRPTTETSDAILSIDLDDGSLDWVFQATADDAFTMACTTRAQQNCPAPAGPDVDFGMSPMVIERSDGKVILVAGQKSGTVWALDPDDGGAVLWSTQIGKGGVLGGIHWGMATDGQYAYAANADRGAATVDINPDMEWSPGLFALDLFTGEVAWSTPTPDVCSAGADATAQTRRPPP